MRKDIVDFLEKSWKKGFKRIGVVGLPGLGKTEAVKTFCKKHRLPYYAARPVTREIMERELPKGDICIDNAQYLDVSGRRAIFVGEEIPEVDVEYRVEPREYRKVSDMWKKAAEERKMEIYGMVGGFEDLIEKASPGKSWKDNFKLLEGEIRSLGSRIFQFSGYYPSILEAISRGFWTISEIEEYTGISKNKIPRYLGSLSPYLLRIPGKPDRFVLKDPFFAFYFRLIFSGESQKSYDRHMDYVLLLVIAQRLKAPRWYNGGLWDGNRVIYWRWGKVKGEEIREWRKKGLQVADEVVVVARSFPWRTPGVTAVKVEKVGEL